MITKAFALSLILNLVSISSSLGQIVWQAQVVSSDNEAIPFATVELKDLKKGTTTDEFGNFSFSITLPLRAEFHIRALGFTPFRQHIEFIHADSLPERFVVKPDPLLLNQMVVSANRYTSDRTSSAVTVQVLGATLLKATNAQHMAETLPFQPGVRVENNCQNCGFTQVRMNGLGGEYAQILVNNRPVFSALNSVYGLEQLPTALVERVEVVRGGGSVLYGSNAIAGTVNIITKEPVLDSWELASNSGFLGQGTTELGYNGNLSLVSEDLRRGITLYGVYRQRDPLDRDGDGFTELTQLQQQSGGVKAFFKPTNRQKITLESNLVHEQRRGGDRLHLKPEWTDITEQVHSRYLLAGITHDYMMPSQHGVVSSYFSGQLGYRDSYYGGLGGGRTSADSAFARLAFGNTDDMSWVAGSQFTMYFSKEHTFMLGAEVQQNAIVDVIPGYQRQVDQTVHATGTFVQHEWKPSSRITLLAGIRLDAVKVRGDYRIDETAQAVRVHETVLNPRINLLLTPWEEWQVRIGYNRGFRAPQAFSEELHVASVSGQPSFVVLSSELKSEFSHAFTGSIAHTHSDGWFQSNVIMEGFYTNIQNTFTPVSTGATVLNGSILKEIRNGSGASVYGVNMEWSMAFGRTITMQWGGTVQRALFDEQQSVVEFAEESELTTNVATKQFLRTPNVYGFGTISWQASAQYKVDLSGLFTGSMLIPRVEDELGNVSLRQTPRFYELNIKASRVFSLSRGASLMWSVGIQNILQQVQRDIDQGPTRDADYIYGPMRPRTVFTSLTLSR